MVSTTKAVMVVDDEPIVLNVTARILEAKNYRTIKAKNCQECLDNLKEEVPDVILLDLMMPGLTARELLDKIEENERWSKIKIIVLSAVHLPEAEENGLLASRQIVDFVEKPFTARGLIDAIEKAITN